MRRILSLIILTGISFILVSCQKENIALPNLETIKLNDYNNAVSCSTNDFEMKLFSNKEEYQSTEKITIWGTLEYIGNNDEIKIWHGGTSIFFSITNGKDFNMDPVQNLPLLSTTLEKGKINHFDFQKSGGWSADDPKAEFWEKFFSEEDLYLPADNYTITMTTGFSLTPNIQNDVGLICELQIRVIE